MKNELLQKISGKFLTQNNMDNILEDYATHWHSQLDIYAKSRCVN